VKKLPTLQTIFLQSTLQYNWRLIQSKEWKLLPEQEEKADRKKH